MHRPRERIHQSPFLIVGCHDGLITVRDTAKAIAESTPTSKRCLRTQHAHTHTPASSSSSSTLLTLQTSVVPGRPRGRDDRRCNVVTCLAAPLRLCFCEIGEADAAAEDGFLLLRVWSVFLLDKSLAAAAAAARVLAEVRSPGGASWVGQSFAHRVPR